MLEQHSGHEDLQNLLRMAVLAAAVGNLDMHAKNISLTHDASGAVKLAPAYDFVPQAHQATAGEMALAIAGEYRHAEIDRNLLVEEGRSWGIRNADRIVSDVLEALLAIVTNEDPHPRAHPSLADDIVRFTQNLLDGAK